MDFWHGGVRGLKIGDFILPPNLTKKPCLSDFGAASVHRRDRVYVTTQQEAALLYAAGVGGFIYKCTPIGVVEDDPDCILIGLSYQCEKAHITGVIKPKRNDIKRALRCLVTDC